MFAHPNSSPGPHGGGLKRLHEDDSADLTNSGACGFGEHRNKRHHALPLRSSPLAKRSSPPPSFQPLSFTQSPHSPPRNITPVSDTEGTVNKMDGYQESFGQAQNGQGWTNQLLQSTEMDTDMGMAGVETAESTSPNHLRPGAFQPDPIAPTIAGRMPTPIQPSFAAQVRGNNWGGAAGNIMQTSSGMQYGHSQQTTSSEDTGYQGADESTPRSLNQGSMSSWNPIQNRPLPSPISESGGEDVGSPDMILDNVSHFRAQHAAAFSNMPPRSDSTMSLPSYLHDGAHDLDHHHNNTEHGSPPASGVNAMETDCPTTPSPRKGHTRSRHTLNNWTIQPGMKKSFSIGYRADCEKCRNKVPGHFNHIIVS